MGWLKSRHEKKAEEALSGMAERAHGPEEATVAASREIAKHGGGQIVVPGSDKKQVITYVLPDEPETPPPGTREQRVALMAEAIARADAKGEFVGDPVAELDQMARRREVDPELLAFIRDKLATDPRMLYAYPNAEAAVAIRAARAAELERPGKHEEARSAKDASDRLEPGRVPFTWALQQSVDKAVDPSGWTMVPAEDGGVIAGTSDRGGDAPRDWAEAGPVFLQHILQQSGSPNGPFYRLVIWDGTIPAAELDVGHSMATIYDM